MDCKAKRFCVSTYAELWLEYCTVLLVRFSTSSLYVMSSFGSKGEFEEGNSQRQRVLIEYWVLSRLMCKLDYCTIIQCSVNIYFFLNQWFLERKENIVGKKHTMWEKLLSIISG